MKYQQWLWQGSIAALLGVALANSVTAQRITNQSDTSNAVVVDTTVIPTNILDSGGNTANSIFGIRRRAFDPTTREITFDLQGLEGQYSIDPRISLDGSFDGNSGDSESLSYDTAQCTGEKCQGALAGKQKITLNEIAELLELDLERSLDQLAMAEEAVREAASEPRRIVRRSSQRECVNPYIRARDEVDRKLEQSQQFIEQVDPIKPENNLW